MFFYQASGRGLYLQLTDGGLFFWFCLFLYLCWGWVLWWIKLRLAPCFFVIKTIHNMVGFGCVLWGGCGRRFLCVENAVYKIDFICSVWLISVCYYYYKCLLLYVCFYGGLCPVVVPKCLKKWRISAVVGFWLK